MNNVSLESLLVLTEDGKVLEVNYEELQMLVEFLLMHDTGFQVLEADSESDKYKIRRDY